LFALSTITNPNASNTLSFIEDGHRYLPQLDQMRAHVNDLLAQLYPDIIALTDAWDFTDASLCSAVNAEDGNAYERLMAGTRLLSIN
jgi:acyl-CoA oxidase